MDDVAGAIAGYRADPKNHVSNHVPKRPRGSYVVSNSGNATQPKALYL